MFSDENSFASLLTKGISYERTLSARTTGNLGVWILLQVRVEHCVGDLHEQRTRSEHDNIRKSPGKLASALT